MRSDTFPYHAYIIRIWKETLPQWDNDVWRFSLSTPIPEERQGFASPESLCNTLYQELLKLMQNEQINAKDYTAVGQDL